MKVQVVDRFETVIDGALQQGKISVSDDKIARLYSMAFKYADPIASLIRELTSNAIDAHTEASLLSGMTDEQLARRAFSEDSFDDVRKLYTSWKEKPVIVRLKDEDLLGGHAQFIVQDFGPGISPDRMEKVFSNLFETTKGDNNKEIGGWGLGAKSPLGYTQMFSISANVDGVKYDYMIIDADPMPEWTIVSQEPTDEPNGTTVSVPITKGDYDSFEYAINHQLCYFHGVVFENCGHIIKKASQIYKGKTFIYRQNSPFSNMHICINRVYYPIDFSKIDGEAQYDHPMNLGLYFDIGELQVTPTRESIEYTTSSIELIKQRLSELKTELRELNDKASDNVKSIEDFLYLKYAESAYNSLYLDRDNSVYISNIPRSYFEINARYPKYHNVLHKLPNNVFHRWKRYKRIDQDGRCITLKNTQRNYRANRTTISEDHIYEYDPERIGHKILIADEETKSLTNNYIAECLGKVYLYKRQVHKDEEALLLNKSDPYLDIIKYCDDLRSKDILSLDVINDKTDEERVITLERLKIVNSFGDDIYNRFGIASDDLTEDHIQSIRDFYKEVDDYVLSKFDNYSSIIPDQAWIDERKRIAAEERKNRLANIDLTGSIPAKKYILSHNGDSKLAFGKWSMERLEAKYANYNGLVIYGTIEDDSELKQVGLIMTMTSNFVKHSVGRWTQEIRCHPRACQIIKIAKNNIKFVKNNFPNAKHVTTFLNDESIRLIRYATALKIKEKLPTDFGILTSPIMSIADQNIYKIANNIKAYIDTYCTSFGVRDYHFSHYHEKDAKVALDKVDNSIIAFVSRTKAYDKIAVDWMKDIMFFMRDYPLLMNLKLDQIVDHESITNYIKLIDKSGNSYRIKKRRKRIATLTKKKQS